MSHGEYRPVNTEKLRSIHNATLKVLEKTGLRVDCADYYGPLESVGAKVERNSGIVKFPPHIVEGTIEFLRNQIQSGKRQYLLNGVTNPRWTPPLGFKFGGACIEYLDSEADVVRQPTERDLIRLLQLGEAIDTVGFVGNPVACLIDEKGNEIAPYMQRIKTAALAAKYTTKCGSTEVWNEHEMELLIEIGSIVRGGLAAYEQKPCFITAKETIAPLQFPREDGRILLMLAKRRLPCTIIPMPLTGATSPCSIAGNVLIANAEILGVMTCIHAANPDAMVGGGIISGIMDMATGSASFSAPEALLQDAALARLYDQYYGQDLAIGTGYTDAKYPGIQSLAEKTMKFFSAAQQGRFNFPVGLLAGGKRFSPEQAILDLEVAQSIKRLFSEIEVTDDMLAVDVIGEVGIGKEFLSHEHTLEHFRKNLWSPALADRSATSTLNAERRHDMLAAAHEKVEQILRRDNLYKIDKDRERAIDDVVAKAERILK